MRKKKFLLSLLVVPLCLFVWSCGDDNESSEGLPQLSAATSGTLSVCEDLVTQFSFADTVISSAELIDAGGVVYDSDETYTAPEHCLVNGYMNQRVSDVDDETYQIGFQMRLPTDWNGRFYYQANGGIDGSVQEAVGRFMFSNGDDHAALVKGFAVISSDAGHQQGTPLFGLDPQARLDYGYNAVAELTPMAKDLIAEAYGKQPDRSYFGGCSNGGRHTMVATARYGDLYDGFLVGNPGFNLPKAAISQMYGIQQFSSLVSVGDTDVLDTLKSAITEEEYATVASALLDVCDGLNGEPVDGMVTDLYACQDAFDLDSDVPTCVGDTRTGSCLTSAQKSVLTNIMTGPYNSNNEALYTSFPFDAGMSGSNWYMWEYDMALTRDPGAVAFIWSSPPTPYNGSTELGNYNYINGFSLNDDAPLIYATNDTYTVSGIDFMTPPNPTDLSVVKNRGAKVMVIHGASDPVFSVNDTVDWYENLEAANGGDASNFARLFLVPGMNHCGAGPATDKFDGLEALVEWVEGGVAPESMTASVRSENTELPSDWDTDRTRPLCPYPQIAKYSGTGSTESADSFYCEEP